MRPDLGVLDQIADLLEVLGLVGSVVADDERDLAAARLTARVGLVDPRLDAGDRVGERRSLWSGERRDDADLDVGRGDAGIEHAGIRRVDVREIRETDPTCRRCPRPASTKRSGSSTFYCCCYTPLRARRLARLRPQSNGSRADGIGARPAPPGVMTSIRHSAVSRSMTQVSAAGWTQKSARKSFGAGLSAGRSRGG